LVACTELEIDLDHRQCQIGGKLLNEGDFLSLDGNAGAVYLGRLAALTERPVNALAMIASWTPAAAA
jgi:pyruvate,orthophosphate dikinase